MSKSTLFTTRMFDGERYHDNARIKIVSGKIADISYDATPNQGDVICEGLIAPGFVDLQVNGGGGVLFNSTPNVDGIKKIMSAHAKFGTTAMLPTLITDSVEVMAEAADAIAQAIAENVAGIKGVHFEGPHLSVAKKGAHSERFIRPISHQEWQILSRKDIGTVMVTIAPENVLPQDIERMAELGVIVCIGHTNADFKTTQAAVNAKATGFTHLYNAMSPLTGRAPGVVGCALVNDTASCGIIADGHHVDYVSLLVAVKAKPKGKVFLVTDAMPPVGTEETSFEFFDRQVYLCDGKLNSTTGELAGSVLDMATAVRNCHLHMKLPLDESIRMASQYPASFIKQQTSIGTIGIGMSADFIELSTSLEVNKTWIDGKVVYSGTK